MPTLDDGLLLELIDHVYGAAIDASRWAGVTEALGRAFRARFSLVFGFETATSRVLYTHYWGLPAAALAPYEHTYAAMDVRMPAALRAAAGTVVTDESLIDRAVYRASPIYNEYLRPHDCDHIMAVLPENSPDTRVIISLNRSRHIGVFDVREQEFFGRLVPHLQRAVLMSAKWVSAAGAERLSRDLMDQVHFGIVTLGKDGRIIETNSIAEHLLGTGNHVIRENGRLVAASRAANDLLQRAMAGTVHALLHRAEGEVDPLIIPGASGSPLRLLLAPLPRFEAGAGPLDPLLVAYFFTKDATPAISPATLSLVYHLTPAEARVAAKLAEGHSLAETARLMMVSIETVRTHLKSIFAKTHCESQTALVREILLGPTRSLARD